MELGILKNKNFVKLFVSQLLSLLTVNALSFLVLIKVYEETNSTIASSLIWIAYALPAIIVGPIGAVYVDLSDKRKILVVTNLIQAVTILGYAILLHKFLYISYAVVAVYSMFNQFYVPAETAALPLVTDRKMLPQANGLFFISQQGSAALGIVLAGILSELVGFRSALLVASVFLAIAFVSVSTLPKMKPKKEVGQNIENKLLDFLEKMIEGFRFIRRNKRIFYPFLYLIWLNVMLIVIVINLPVIGTEIIKTTPTRAGFLAILPASIGALTGTLMVSKRLARGIRKKTLVDSALIGLAVSLLLIPIATLMNFWAGRLFLMTGFFVVGLSFVVALVPATTFLQENTPEHLLGRVFGNFWFLETAATMLPVLFSATITDILGIRTLIVILGSLSLLAFLVSKYYIPNVFPGRVDYE